MHSRKLSSGMVGKKEFCMIQNIKKNKVYFISFSCFEFQKKTRFFFFIYFSIYYPPTIISFFTEIKCTINELTFNLFVNERNSKTY